MSAEADRGRVLVTGATGLLGREVVSQFRRCGWQVEGTGMTRAEEAGHTMVNMLDVQEFEDTFPKLLDEFRPSVVIHCVAERRPDKLQGQLEKAMEINEAVPGRVAAFCQERGIWLIHMSTNYVFDGQLQLYDEEAETNPLNTYGLSKLRGEVAVLSAFPAAAIVRVPLIFGPTTDASESSVTALLKSVRAEKASLDNWQERYPTSSVNIAEVLEAFAAKQHESVKAQGPEACLERFGGIFHWQSNEMYTKYTMACAIARLVNEDEGKLSKADAPTEEKLKAAPRQRYECMSCSRLESILEIPATSMKFRTPFEEALKQALAPVLDSTQ